MSSPIHRLPPRAFPFEIEALHPGTREVVWTRRVEKPDGLDSVYIPPLAKMFGHPVAIRIIWADGTVYEEPGMAPSLDTLN